MEKYVIVKHFNTFDIISETFKSMNRIKVLDFDISDKYMVFGASSGGIYVFKRRPCSLIKLVPSTEGSTVYVKISSDELHLAIVNSKGLVVLLESFFVDLTIRTHVQYYHEGNRVTALNWHGNELYSGDHTGKVSVFTLAKAFFQNPSAVLLQLDSSIVQLDAYQNYVLVSTKNHTYLCNREKGLYKQIGGKTRSSYNGACFRKDFSNDSTIHYTTPKDFFKTMENSGDFTSATTDSFAKIYCGRPKGRLWEATFDTSVLRTYNFRNLPQSISNILIIDDSQDAKLEIKICDTSAISFNFNKIYSLDTRYIVTCDNESIHIVDPTTSSLVFSKNGFKDIINMRVLGNFIFILTTDFKMNIFSLQNLEELVVNKLLNKQYYLCADICIHFKNDLIECVKKSTRLSLLLILKQKLDDNKILNELNPIFSALEDSSRNLDVDIKLNRGIMIIDNGHPNVHEKGMFPRDSFVNGIATRETDANFERRNDKICCIYRQFNLNKFQKKAELTEYRNLISNMNIDDVLILMDEFKNCVQETESDDVIKWIESEVVRIASTQPCKKMEPKVLTFLTDAFLKLNSSDQFHCKCYFPLPKAHTKEIEHYDLGVTLYSLLKDKKYFLNNIPYLYAQYLRETENLNNLTCLCLIVQFSDLSLLKEFKEKLVYDDWEEIVKLFIQLKNGYCLNCSENIDLNGIWSWNEFGLLMIGSVGPKNAIRLLKRYSTHISSEELTPTFFSGCIMAMAYDNHPSVMKIVEKYFHNSNQMNSLMECYLQNQYLDRELNQGSKLEARKLQKCSYCDLVLNGPILNQYKKCICGNTFHLFCYTHNDKICSNCLKIRYT